LDAAFFSKRFFSRPNLLLFQPMFLTLSVLVLHQTQAVESVELLSYGGCANASFITTKEVCENAALTLKLQDKEVFAYTEV
jgi:hypothetical protein